MNLGLLRFFVATLSFGSTLLLSVVIKTDEKAATSVKMKKIVGFCQK